ncbi:MAG TPA: tRNA (adenosine(37)-N6)-threonylcarbamoyltransferase complex transferase subunit TsaD [Bacteroidales bacterium]|nr:tRNA (adenosine(37)-N6)-threonylcarbamoyltransferase complex transferase subunit TsaD [Bacteroidales bacterium]
MSITILGIESSCDDTAAAIIKDGVILSNSIANQDVHRSFGGVVPELASRAHQQNIIPVVDHAIKKAGITRDEIDGVAFTRGPGLLGSLMVGTSFAKGFALARNIPIIEVNHLQAHVISLFIDMPDKEVKHPPFPFLCLLVSGGHTQLMKITGPLEMEVIGKTIDDAAGEAFDKCAKVMGLPYPGGPHVDKLAHQGNPERFNFAKPKVEGLDYSFSGLKTSFLYFLRDELKKDKQFIDKNLNDLCASLQHTIINILMEKLIIAARGEGIRHVALAGGVSANSGLREAFEDLKISRDWEVYIPAFSFSTDNAAMIAMTGYFKYMRKEFASQDIAPAARL